MIKPTARGHFVYSNEIINILNEILADAAYRKGQIKIIGNKDAYFLDGQIQAAEKLKVTVLRLEHYGDFYKLKEPTQEEK